MPKPKGVPAKQGKTSVQIKLYFFTNDLAATEGTVRPKHVWDNGTVYASANTVHGIRPAQVQFNSLAEIPLAIEKLLIKIGVKVHSEDRAEQPYVL